MDLNYWEPVQVSLLGEFVKNMAFNRAAINSVAVNNRTGGGSGSFAGGDTAWYMGVNVGKPYSLFNQRGDWNMGVGYRYVESDSVVDGFTDSNFGGGGTNMKGYTLSAAVTICRRSSRVASSLAVVTSVEVPNHSPGLHPGTARDKNQRYAPSLARFIRSSFVYIVVECWAFAQPSMTWS